MTAQAVAAVSLASAKNLLPDAAEVAAGTIGAVVRAIIALTVMGLFLRRRKIHVEEKIQTTMKEKELRVGGKDLGISVQI